MTTEERLQRLERQSRMYRHLFILAALGLVAVLTYGATAPIPEVIQARRFEVIDGNGAAFVRLYSSKYGGVLIVYGNKEDKARVSIGMSHLTGNSGEKTNRTGYIEVRGAGNNYSGVQISSDVFGNGLVSVTSENNGLSTVIDETGLTVHSTKFSEGVQNTKPLVEISGDGFGNGTVSVRNREGKRLTLTP